MGEEFQTEQIPVNDGGGLFDSDGLIDTLIVDCNDLTKLLIENQFVAFSSKIVQMVQKLSRLKDGIKSDIASRDEQIAEYQKVNDELAGQVYGMRKEDA